MVSDLVLEVDGGVEVGNLGVDRFTDELAFRRVHEASHLCSFISPCNILNQLRTV